MTKHSTRRLVLAACCWLVALLSGRSASAVAPMCDQRGASAVAPTPVLPIRDVKLETSAPLPCELPGSALARGTLATGREVPPVPDRDAGGRDAWLRPTVVPCAPAPSDRAAPALLVASPATAAHRPSVFRPPRP